MSTYPTSVDTFTTKVDGPGEGATRHLFAADVNGITAAIVAIEDTLGTAPAGAYSTVKDRIAAAEAGGGGGGYAHHFLLMGA